MKVGVFTGGGDCPGLNAVIRAVVRKSVALGFEVIGIREGWKGLIENIYTPLNLNNTSGIIHTGGTILGTSRTNIYKINNGEKKVIENIKKAGIDALIAIGGEDTLGAAHKLSKAGVNIVGIPKTIDNDLNSTDYTFGFDTAVNIVMEAIDRLHTTAESHNRVMVLEVMGRHAGWIALHSGIAGGADVILIPEKPFKIEEICDFIRQRHSRGKYFSIIVVSEGAKFAQSDLKEGKDGMVLSSGKVDAFGHVRLGGIANIIADEIEKRTGYETRATVLGHIQRGGSPTAFDRVLGTRFGIFAVELVNNKKFGKMAALRGNKIVETSLDEAVGELKTADLKLYDVAASFFG